MHFTKRKTLSILLIILFVSVLSFGFVLKIKGFLSSADVLKDIIPPVENELLVKFKKETSKDKKDKFLAKHNAKIKSRITDIGVDVIDIKTNNNSELKAKVIRKSDSGILDFIEPNYQAQVEAVPNDTYYSTNQSGWYNFVEAPASWDITKGDDTTVAMVDTGVDLIHPDLKDKIVAGYDYYNNDSDPTDDHGHGTATAGIAAAVTNNALGVAGTGWSSKIMPYKVCSSSGSCPYSKIAQAITDASNKNVSAISISIAGSSSSSTLQNAVDYAASKNVVVVAASGNSGTSAVSYPAACNNAIAVGALDSSFTNRATYSNYGSALDVMSYGGGYTTTKGGGYGGFGGTSAATPYVAGLAALIESINPSFSVQQATDYITQYAVDMTPSGWDQYTGWGSINFQNSLGAAAFGSYSISGHVELGSYFGDITQVSVTVELRKQGGSTTTRTVNLDSSGNYTLTNVPADTYDLAFNASHWLQRVVPNVVVNQNLTGINASLPNGDVDLSGEVDLGDSSYIDMCFSQTSPNDPCFQKSPDKNADLDGSGEIDLGDFSIIDMNFGLANE